MFWVELVLFLACILIGARIGGIGLGTTVARASRPRNLGEIVNSADGTSAPHCFFTFL